ncbi:MAG: ATP-binding protein [Candidatus Caldarchaeum sp.]
MQGKSGVNIARLVRNIADQYSFNPEVAALIELVANSLDAKASRIDINLRPEEGVLEVVDDGRGMNEREFREYHDFASSTKIRGSGIGFAGQGAKLALNFCSKIVTETRSRSFWGATEWWLDGDEAPYHSIDQKSLEHQGTKITLYLDKKSLNFYNKDMITRVIYEHYFPLVDRKLREEYRRAVYKNNLTIFVNGKEVVRESFLEKPEKVHEFYITLYRKPKAFGRFALLKVNVSDGLEGVAVCCFGKVIERTFFKKEPRSKERIVGWIEAPYLIRAVTTDKCRFQTANKLWEGFFRKAQKEFSDWLESVGLIERPGQKELTSIKLEQEINKIINQMPDLTIFGGLVKKRQAIPGEGGEERRLDAGGRNVAGTIGGETEGTGIPIGPRNKGGEAPSDELGEGVEAVERRRIIRGGIRLAFDDRPELSKESWFDGDTVTINKAHAAYLKADKKKLLDYHILKCAVMSIIEFNVERDPKNDYKRVFEISERFFRIWGQV